MPVYITFRWHLNLNVVRIEIGYQVLFLKPGYFFCSCFNCMMLSWFSVSLHSWKYNLCFLALLIWFPSFRRYWLVGTLTRFLFYFIIFVKCFVFSLSLTSFLLVSFVCHSLQFRIVITRKDLFGIDSRVSAKVDTIELFDFSMFSWPIFKDISLDSSLSQNATLTLSFLRDSIWYPR